MQINRLIIPSLALSAVLVTTAFGNNGLKNLLTTQINSAEAAVPTMSRAGGTTVANGPVAPAGAAVSVFEYVPAPEVPNRAPDAAGVVSGREGDTLTLQSFLQVVTSAQSSTVAGETGLGIAPGDAAPAGVTIVSGAAIIASPTGSQGQPADINAGSGPIALQSITVTGQGELVASGAVSAASGSSLSASLVGSALPAQATPQKVVVTKVTKIYHDVTPLGQQPAGGHQTIRQTLEAGSLDDLTDKMLVTVWGHMDAGQLTADVIVYQNQFSN